MSSVLTVESRPGAGSSRVRPPAARPVVRSRRGPARPVSVAGRGVPLCPSPVAPARPEASGLVRRMAAAAGMVLASAAVVVGLGLLADASAASTVSDEPVVPVVVQP